MTVDLDLLFEQKEIAPVLIEASSVPEAVVARISLVDKFNYSQQAVNAMTTNKVLLEYRKQNQLSESKKSIDFDSVLREWAYRCDNGYPEMGNENDMLHLQNILEELGVESPFPKITEAPVKTPATAQNSIPAVTITNKTALQEGLTCVLYDLITSDATVDRDITNLQKSAITSLGKKSISIDEELIELVVPKIGVMLKANFNRYGAAPGQSKDDPKGSLPPKNLEEWCRWVYKTKNIDGIETVNNSLTAARTLKTLPGASNAIIIRDKRFDAIREHATTLAKALNISQLKPDNWCPGDVYLVQNDAIIDRALSSVSLNATINGVQSLNSYFNRSLSSDSILAVSLKEQTAQAGKATEFLSKVFSTEYDAKLDAKSIKSSDTDAKSIGKETSAIERYQSYSPSFPNYISKAGTKRQKSYKSALLKGDETALDSSVNIILKGAGMSPIKFKDLITYKDPSIVNSKGKKLDAAELTAAKQFAGDKFYSDNRTIFDKLDNATAIIKQNHSKEDTQTNLQNTFIATRNKFIRYLKEYDVQVKGVDSKKFYQEIMQGTAPTNVLAKKIGVYDLAIKILDKWVTKEMSNPAYSKLTKLTNPFAALTAFAVAESGINPGFWKVIGSERGNIGEKHWFDPKAKIAVINDKTSALVLIDSPTAADFKLEYVTAIGTHNYDTKLTFRYSKDQIRIEIEKLTARN
jgi:hypothetical protein